MVSEIQKSQKVREKSGNFKIMVLLKKQMDKYIQNHGYGSFQVKKRPTNY